MTPVSLRFGLGEEAGGGASASPSFMRPNLAPYVDKLDMKEETS